MSDASNGLVLEYICDGMRHLVCLPYSVENLHAMASDLGLGRHWFHRGASYPHYDIPVKRRAEIEARCRKIPARVLLKIVKGEVVTVADLDAVMTLTESR